MRKTLLHKGSITRKSIFVFIMLLCLTYPEMYGQNFRGTLNDPNLTFFQKEEKIDHYFKNKKLKTVVEKKQFKKYNRWKTWAATRLDKNGYIITKEEEDRAIKAHKYQYKTTQRQTTSVWEELGPFSYEGNSEVKIHGSGMGRVSSVAVEARNHQIIYAGAPNGGLWKSVDAGKSWEPLGDQFDDMQVQGVAIHPNNPDIVVIYNFNYIYKSSDGGRSWKKVSGYYSSLSGNTSILFHPTKPDIIYSGTGDGIAKSTDGGETFSLVFKEFWIDQIRFKPGNPDVIYGTGMKLARSTDGGNTFSDITSKLGYSGREILKIDVTPADPERVYIVQSYSRSKMRAIYKSTNSGESFETVYDVNGGGKVQLIEYQASRNMHIAVSDTDPDVVHIGGSLSHYKSTDGGVSFEILGDWQWGDKPTYIHADVLFMEYINGVLYAGTDGGLFKSSDKGKHFEDLTKNGLRVRMFYRIGVSKSNPEIVIGGSQDIGHSIMRGAENPSFECLSGDGFECTIDPENPDNIYVVTAYGGFMMKSTNGGESFKDIKLPSNLGSGSSYSFVMSPHNGDIIYYGADHVYKNNTGGEQNNWEKLTSSLVPPQRYIKELSVAPSDPNYIYFSRWYTNDAIWMSKNAESSNPTWTKLDNFPSDGSINYIAVDPNQPEKIGFVTASGDVFTSTDTGNNWTNIKRNLPLAPIYTIVYDSKSNNGIYIGTEKAVYYTNDMMTEWIPFKNQLPNVRVNDLEIHEETGKIYAGTFGRGLWYADLYGEGDQYSIVAPNALVAKQASSSSIHLTWADNSNQESSFEIQRAKENGTFSTITTLSSNTTRYTDTGLEGHIKYRYRVRATGSNNKYSKFSNISTAKTLNDGNSNTAYSIMLKIVPDEFPKQISWELKDKNDKILYSGGDYQETSTRLIELELNSGCYKLIMKDSAGDGVCCSPGDFVKNGFYELKDENGTLLASGKEYEYEEVKTFCMGKDNTPPVMLKTPTSLDANTNNITVNLTWSDNSSNETGFELHRKKGSGSFLVIKTLGVNVTNYTDQVSENSTYEYKVRALGKNNQISNFSVPVSVVTKGNEGGSNKVILTINPDNYTHEISWELQNDNGTVIEKGSGYSGKNTITESFELSTGCYTFVIEDSANDGICCDYGSGSYIITDQEGEILASGGEYKSKDTKKICLNGESTNNIEKLQKNKILITPNPVDDIKNILNIQLGKGSGYNKVVLINQLGARVYEKNIDEKERISIAMDKLSSGTYFIKFTGNNRPQVFKIIKN